MSESTSAPTRSRREERVLELIETARSKRPRFRDEHITLAHGAGGKATQTLIEGLLVPAFGGTGLEQLGDAGLIPAAADAPAGAPRLVMTSDSFVVSPLRFPGGSIGELAVNGTVNDLAMAGARASALTVSMILEEGLAVDRRCARRSRRSPRPPRAPGSRSSAATRRSCSAASRTACICARQGSVSSTAAPPWLRSS